VLALLRSIASSPAAAAATLRNRAAPAATTTVEEADEVGRRSVLDQDEADDAGRPDAVPGADPDPAEEGIEKAARRRLRALADRADALAGAEDAKLGHATRLVSHLVHEGHQVVVFCRFIPTADYVASHLRQALGPGVAVDAVTGLLPPAEREQRIVELGGAQHRVLVATDCLSEGINLQESFDAVVHYDLPWNPTRLEQREGRVDRFNQPSPTVRVATIFGVDNVIDEIVLDVLLRKHKKIRSSLGISIPVPGSNDEFIETIFERLFTPENQQLSLFTEPVRAVQQSLFEAWDLAAAKEQRSRTRYAQHAISITEVATELAEARAAVGSAADIARFVRRTVIVLGGTVSGDGTSVSGDPVRLDVSGLPRTARDMIGGDVNVVVGRFQPTVRPREAYLSRTHPLVEGLASYLLDTALDDLVDSPAARSGAIRTAAVMTTTVLLLVRQRFDLAVGRRADSDELLLAEALAIAGFEGPPSAPVWLEPAVAEALLTASPTGNVATEQRIDFVRRVVDHGNTLTEALGEQALARAGILANSHRRVRRDAGASSRVTVRPHLPVDALGVFVLLPA
jgi:hypothetical protein